MRISLEKRLTSALKKKEAADKEKLEKEVALAYEKRLMQKIVEESKRLEQALENLKVVIQQNMAWYKFHHNEVFGIAL